MTHIITRLCLRDTACVEVCPVECMVLGKPEEEWPLLYIDPDTCIDCAKCAKACPARLPVDRKPQIRSAECTLCMECVAVCPAAGALAVKVSPARVVQPRMIAAAIAIIFFGIVIGAKATGNWKTEMPEHIYRALVVSHDQIAHPR